MVRNNLPAWTLISGWGIFLLQFVQDNNCQLQKYFTVALHMQILLDDMMQA